MSSLNAELVLNILDEMWYSDDWTDPMDSLLNDWTPEQASRPLHPNIASVEAMINHTAFWEDVALRHLTGESLESLGPLEEAADGKNPDWMPRWPETATHYRNVRRKLQEALKETADQELLVQPKSDGVIRESRVSSRAPHAAYHAGQLSFMRRLASMPDSEFQPRSADTAPHAARSKEILLNLMDWAWKSGNSFDIFSDLTKDLSPEDADQTPNGLPSITHIVNHMAFWEEYVAKRLRGESTENMPPAQPGGLPPDPAPWPQAAELMLRWHDEVESALGSLTSEELWAPRPGTGKHFEQGKSAHWLVCGVINHYAYHLGQIVLLRQMMGHEDHLI